MALKNDELEFTAEAVHHEQDTMKINIQIYQSGPVMKIRAGDEQISLTQSEIQELARVFEFYGRAVTVMKEGNK